ncbi:ATP-binding cassette domain-containing protein [Streptomyces sp. VRA16 Mangrove soil]|uniref:ABC transporter ATP-binding protein n=1 Tax=Streptomyces sp. VRA16 Mangrove soil TaxID=2817434 RepID=UPI001A9F0336|nr:ATP-binding cassette domain-containing protein [Streptomyces sp. VRA16 Mangrove soil]MBO1334462.1 ATP-binding cassette domain-containing protein [Streptomyces sp. VRA16 Mangrove soil]
MIVAHELVKEFRIPERGPGLAGSVSTLFTRRHRIVRAVDEVSFEIPAGSRTAYIGANGAGKSTTIKMLTGIMTPTSGYCRVRGIEPYRDRQRNARSIGVVFGQRSQLWWDLSVPDSFRILRRIYDIPAPVYDRNLALYRELLDIDALGTTPVRQLSLGQRMRAEIAASLLHDPAVVFWDEPTIGLDMVLKEAVRELVLRAHHDLGTTVVLTSHDIADIAAICDSALVVDRGRVVHQGTIQDLLRTADRRSVLFDHREPLAAEAVCALVEAQLPGVRAVPADGGRVQVDYPAEEFTSRQVLAFLLDRFDLVDCYAPEPDLEDVLRQIYGRSTATAPAEVSGA